MRIAVFNWRDISHPSAGGAEVYVHSILRLLAAKGHSVTLFTSRYQGAPPRETIDGVEHVRYAGRLSIYPASYLCYNEHIKGRYDAIMESINGPPFFTTLFAKEPVVPLIHQLTRQNWFSGISYPLAFLGYHLEDSMLSLYKGRAAAVPSASTESDLRSLGFSDVTVIHGAADVVPAEAPRQGDTLLYLGRLTRSKRVDHALKAFSIIHAEHADAKLVIAGSGPERGRLESLASELGLQDSVEFTGRVSQDKKARLLSEASLMLFPAAREGWGLTVLEANACSTPVIGYDVHGLRDSIIPGVNGDLARDGDHLHLAELALRLLEDEGSLERLSSSSLDYSKRFSWSKAADAMLSLMERVIA